MIKAITGEPPNQTLILGLSFENLITINNHPMDSYIRVKGEEISLPLDVVLFAGQSMYSLDKDNKTGKPIFIIGFSLTKIAELKQHPSRILIRIKKEDYHIPFDIMIFSDKDEITMMEKFSDLITSDTLIKIDDKLKQ